MSPLPDVGGKPRSWSNAWETIRYALDDTRRTVRLCVILVVFDLASVIPFLVMALVRHHLG